MTDFVKLYAKAIVGYLIAVASGVIATGVVHGTTAVLIGVVIAPLAGGLGIAFTTNATKPAAKS